jgi:hypothetical protein
MRASERACKDGTSRAAIGPARGWTVVALAALAAGVALAACGGGKPAAQRPVGGGGEEWSDSEGDDPDMIGVERMDEIKQILDRKRVAAARCLADVVNDGKIDKNSSGHLALGFVISPAGKATSIKVLEDSLDSPDLEQCVIGKVQLIDFGPLPKPLDWSYTFAFESM